MRKYISDRAAYSAILVLFIIPLFSSIECRADRVRPMNLEQLVDGAELIFEGECTAVRTGKDSASGMLATWFTFRVTRRIMGDVGETFELKQFGGSEGDTHMQGPSVRYQVGEQVLLFLYGVSDLGFSSAVGLQQGKFLIQEIPETKAKYATNGLPAKKVFENMNVNPPSVNAKGVALQGQERLLSERLELNQFRSEIQRLVDAKEKKRKLEKQ